ncbi:MAG: hypothetical protein QM747_06755 [Nocardioides sp.]
MSTHFVLMELASQREELTAARARRTSGRARPRRVRGRLASGLRTSRASTPY